MQTLWPDCKVTVKVVALQEEEPSLFMAIEAHATLRAQEGVLIRTGRKWDATY